MKRIGKLILCYILISQFLLMTPSAKPDWPADVGIEATAGIVIDADSGAMLFGKNIHETYPPASITKLLTALIVLENCELDEMVTISNSAMTNVEADAGNSIAIAEGDQLSVEDCLYALLLRSCNQVANALAEHVAGGDMDAFVKMMNDRIAEIGCIESHFGNPSGLNHDEQVVSAYDMALIARTAFQNPKLMEISSSLKHTLKPTINHPEGMTISTEHRLLYTTEEESRFYYPPAVAGKTGYLLKAGNTVVTYAEKDGRREIAVILKGQAKQYFVDCKNLLEFGFQRFENYNVAEHIMDSPAGDEPVVIDKTSYERSELTVDEGGVITLPKDAAFADAEVALTREMPAGHPELAVGMLEYTYNEQKVGGAYVLLKATPSEASSQESGGAQEPESGDEEEEKAKKAVRPGGLFAGLAIGAIAAALGAALAAIIIYRRKKEARELARRREERRKRRMQDGAEEEFERLLKERIAKTGKKEKKEK